MGTGRCNVRVVWADKDGQESEAARPAMLRTATMGPTVINIVNLITNVAGWT